MANKYFTKSGVEYKVGKEVIPCILPDKDHVLIHIKTIDLRQYRQYNYFLSKHENQQQVESIENWAIETMAETLK